MEQSAVSTHGRITNDEDLYAVGRYSWPGGYANGFIARDGSALCFDCAQDELGGMSETLSWFCSANYEPETCEVCNRVIE